MRLNPEWLPIKITDLFTSPRRWRWEMYEWGGTGDFLFCLYRKWCVQFLQFHLVNPVYFGFLRKNQHFLKLRKKARQHFDVSRRIYNIYTFDIIILFFHSWCFIRHLAREITNLPRFNSMKNTWKWHFSHAKTWDSDRFFNSDHPYGFGCSTCWNLVNGTVWPFDNFHVFFWINPKLSFSCNKLDLECLPSERPPESFPEAFRSFGGDDVIDELVAFFVPLYIFGNK